MNSNSHSFASLNIVPAQLKNLMLMGHEEMTDIQAEALPFALDGDDLIAQAKTGSGKTAAFGIPLLDNVNSVDKSVQALVMCPTRELSTQVAEELRRLAKYKDNIKITVLCGGVSIGPQIKSLLHGSHVVVGTPGRLFDLLQKEHLDLSRVQTLVLDEADRMLEMGFKEQISDVVKYVPEQRQTMLFSATFPDDIVEISERFQTNPQEIIVEAHHARAVIDQQFYICQHHDKLPALVRLINANDFSQAMIFCNTKKLVAEVHDYLESKGYSSLSLHGDMEQREREQVLIQFRHKSASFLVATDVAARGLDIEALPAVINYELPREQDTYVHRIGRTGRAGMEGVSLTIFTEKERFKLGQLGQKLDQVFEYESIDSLPKNRITPSKPEFVTLYISGGRKDKIRKGDILGALTKTANIEGRYIGQIDIAERSSYVAVKAEQARNAASRLNQNKIKGRKFKVGFC
jgi:ATP-independent RNA helicase DbpA